MTKLIFKTKNERYLREIEKIYNDSLSDFLKIHYCEVFFIAPLFRLLISLQFPAERLKSDTHYLLLRSKDYFATQQSFFLKIIKIS